jgi:hypothetical protein
MTNQIITLAIVILSGLLYLFFYAKIQNSFFNSISTVKNNAILTLYGASLISASINLIEVAEISEDAIRFFINDGLIFKAIYFSFFFFLGMWIFSFVLFRISFLIISILSKENEKSELNKNNMEIALTHSIIVISLSFVIAPVLVTIAQGFIPYPDLPF